MMIRRSWGRGTGGWYLVLKLTVEHVGDSLEAAVRMIGET